MEIPIIFEDEWMCVIEKPAGMVTNNAESVKEETVQGWFSAKHQIQNSNNQINNNNLEFSNLNLEFINKGGVVHRLDKDTSGILVLAKTVEAYEGLKKQFMERTTRKEYTALVHGEFKEETGELSTPIERNPVDKKKFYVGKDLSRMAITEWRALGSYQLPGNSYQLMELLPHTGRTHQLRVHMQYLHHPIVSDPIYGYRKTWEEDLQWCPRLFLHAGKLKICHPITKEPMEFKAELPNDLATALQKLVH